MSHKPTDNGRHQALSQQDRETVAKAIHCLEAVYNVKGIAITSPAECRYYLKLKLYGLPYELFACLLLDNRHRVIRYTELFRGTIDGASVHPREVVRLVLENKAAAVILAHFVPRPKMGKPHRGIGPRWGAIAQETTMKMLTDAAWIGQIEAHFQDDAEAGHAS